MFMIHIIQVVFLASHQSKKSDALKMINR